MTLRARLLTLIVITVALSVLALALVNLNNLVNTLLGTSIERAETTGRQIQAFLLRRIDEASSAPVRGRTLADLKRSWREIVSSDPDLLAVLVQAMAQPGATVEINIAGEDSVILVSSNPRQSGMAMVSRPALVDLRDDTTPVGRALTILTGSGDYELRFPLAVVGTAAPVFTTQIMVSPILLRGVIKPQLIEVASVSAIALAISLAAAFWSAHLALRPLTRINHLIDRIASGEDADKVTAPYQTSESRELAIIESKLSLLGEQYRGARQDASQLRVDLDSALAKLDVGTRRRIVSTVAISERLVAINSLTSRVAHEIKNPLNSIALRLELLRSRLAGESDEELDILSQEVGRLDRVVKTFLDYSRPVELSFSPIDVAGLVREIARFLEPEAASRNITISVEFPEGDPLIIQGDRELLRQAILNIAVNGIEAMSSGGTMTFQLTCSDELCQLRISDTGPGIPAELRDKIFQLYFTTKKSGTGIGLAMTFRAIQLHGGSVDLAPGAECGSTFVVTLPTDSAKETDQ